jgi:leucine dehydrogenase
VVVVLQRQNFEGFMLKLKQIRAAGYEKVVIGEDLAARLHAIIAVHSTALGPSLGGVRMWPYPSEKTALQDALRLAQAMTFKAAISGLKLGGGKAVVVGDPRRDKSRALFLALGKMIARLHGIYIAAEDSGIEPRDLDTVAEKTKHVTGTSPSRGGSGDPSPATAKGILIGIEAASRAAFGSTKLEGMTVAIQGLGQVGLALAKLLARRGVRLIASDVSQEKIRRARKILRFKIVSPSVIHKVPAEIFSPCALGGVLHPASIREIRARIVAGGANNQFASERRDSAVLHRRGILHAPDYVINAGGLIQLYVKEILKEANVTPWLERIGETLAAIFLESQTRNLAPLAVADRMTRQKIRRVKKRNNS